MSASEFVTAINCIDGRAQQPVIDWAKTQLHVRYVDMITEPGADGVLTTGLPEKVAELKARTRFSHEGHATSTILVVAHHGCLGNPVSPEEHLAHVRRGVEVVASWGWPVRVIGLWVTEYGWVEEVCAL